jgi:hypothetical protein
MGLGEGSSNAPLQGSMGGTSALYNSFAYGGGHIPTSPPLLCDATEYPVYPNMRSNLFGVGSQGHYSYTTSMGSFLFSLFGVFGNNTFLSTFVSGMGNPCFRQQNPLQGTIPIQGEMQESPTHMDLIIHGRDQFPD